MYTVQQLWLAMALLCLAAAGFAQGAADTGKTIQMLRGNEVLAQWAPETLASLPRAFLTVKDEGVDVRYEGVWVHELLAKAGLPQGAQLRGEAMLRGIIAEASDGYRVLFTLAELDPAFREPHVLVADRLDGKPLLAHHGQFRLVVGGDKRGARSVRMLARLHVVDGAGWTR